MAPIIDDLTPQSPINALAVPPPIENTWTRISKIVRGLDEAKVKDYKEDIDTILVFAGLFSAVLTAFLVESYQTLQQDPMNTVVSLLQQIAVQTSSFVVTSTFLNSTAPQQNPNTTSTFHPTVNAQRINILWFASLVISLATASLGIIVKQWLREYLAGDYTSPQARLRIRHFRYPGLERWKVFEIAAVLPLLLQISLALFLVGLCYFTAEVHQSIGHTTLPLVSAWAFFIIAVSFFPVITPVCPYKTSLLKESMNAVRQQLFRITALWISSVSPHRLPKFLVSKAFKERPDQKTLLYDEEQVVRDQKHDIEILLAVDAIQADDQLLNDVMWEALQQADLDPEDLAKFLFTVVGHRAQCDVSSLLPRQFLNLKALPKQTYAAIMDMVADLIIREAKRLSLDASSTGNTSSDTSPTANAPKLDQWLEHSICLLLSESKFLHSERVNKVLCHCLSESRHHHQLIPRLIHSRINILTSTSTSTSDSDSDTFLFVLERLKGGLALIDDTKKFLSIMQRLFQQPLSLPSPIRTPGPGPQVVMNAFADDGRSVHEEDTYFYVPKNCEQLVVELFVPRILDAVERKRWTASHYVLLTRTLELAYTGGASGKGNGDGNKDGDGDGDGDGDRDSQVIRPAVVKVVEKLLKSSSVGNAYAVYEVALGMNRKSGTAKAAAQDAYIDVVMSSSTEDRSAILSQFITFIKTHSQDHHYVHTIGTHSTTSVTFDPLSSTLLQLHLIHHIQETEGEPSNQHKHQWKHIFELLLPRIRLAFLWSRAEHRELATQCLKFIEVIEPSERAAHLLNRPNLSQGSLFADELIQTLEDFLPYHAPVQTWRMQRLRLLESRKLPLTRRRVQTSRIEFPVPQRSFTPVPVSQLVRDRNGGNAVDDDSDVEELDDDDSPVGSDPLEKIFTILGNSSSQRPADQSTSIPPQAETEPHSEAHEGEPTEGIDVTPKPEPPPYTPAHRRTPNRPVDMDESSRISLLDRLAANLGVQLPLDTSSTPGPEPLNVDPNVDATTSNDDKPSPEGGQPRPTTPTPDTQTRTVDIATEMSTTPLLAALLSSLEVTDSGELQGIDRGSSEEDDRARVPVHPAAAGILRALGLPVNSTDPEESSVDMDVGWVDPSLTVSELKEVVATHSSMRPDTQEGLVATPSVLPVDQPEQDMQAREQPEAPVQASADGQPVASLSLVDEHQGENDQQKDLGDDDTASSPNPQIVSIQADNPAADDSAGLTVQTLEDGRSDDTATHSGDDLDLDKKPPDGALPFSSLSPESLVGEVMPGDLPEVQNLEEPALTHATSEANVDQDIPPSERPSNGHPPLDGRSSQPEHEPPGPTQDVTDFAKWVAKVIGTDVEALVPDTSTSNGDDDAKIPEWMPWGVQNDESSGPLQHPQDAEAQNATRSEDNSDGAHLDVPVQEDTDGLEWLRLMLLETEEERSQDMQDDPSLDSPQGNVETEDDAHPEIIRAESDLREIQSLS